MRLWGHSVRPLLVGLFVVGLAASCTPAPPKIAGARSTVANKLVMSSVDGSTTTCAQPDSTEDFAVVAPAAVDLEAKAVSDAIIYAAQRGAQSVRIYRHDCLVGASGNDIYTSWSKMPAWSMTKGVVSVVAGRAYTMGLLDIDASIGKYLPDLDDTYKRITVRNLLTQTSGLRFAWVNDLNDAGQFDSVSRLFKRPFEAEPGTEFIYAQTTITAIVAVIEAAVGEDFQAFTTREVFEPIGIKGPSWSWGRDLSGRTQGFAFLDMTPTAFARIGSLLLNKGTWNGHSIISPDYIEMGSTGSDINWNYGFLWRTNHGPDGVDPAAVDGKIESTTERTFWLSGMFNQNVFMIPELDMVVVRMGLPADVFADPMGEPHGNRPDWDYNFFRVLMAGVGDTDVADPGPWDKKPADLVDSIGGADHIVWIDLRPFGIES